MLNRRIDSLLNIPFKGVDPRSKGSSFYSKVVRDIRDAARKAVYSMDVIVGSVSHLLMKCSPSAIFFGIRAIVIDSIDTVFRARRVPHVGQKPSESITIPSARPFLAHVDAPTAVRRVADIGFDVASRIHGKPLFVKWVRPSGILFLWVFLASTAFAVAYHKAMRMKKIFFTAHATAQNHPLAPLVFKDGEVAVSGLKLQSSKHRYDMYAYI